MTNKIVHQTVKRTEEDYTELFDQAVELCLRPDAIKYRDEIIELFVRSFLNERKIDKINVGELNPGLFSKIYGCNDSNGGIFLAKRFFSSKKSIPLGIEAVFHEMEHEDSARIHDREFYYAGWDFTYVLSPNELKSRMAGIAYMKMFIERAEYIMKNNPKYATKENVKFLEYCKKTVAKTETKLKQTHQKALQTKEKKKDILRKKAFKTLEKLKELSKSNSKLLKKQFNNHLNFILDYLNTYKDKELLKAITKMFKGTHIENLCLKTRAFEYSPERVDELVLARPNGNFVSDDELAKHNLLFKGAMPNEVAMKNPEIKKLTENFDFNGVPFQVKYKRGEGLVYIITINNQTMQFKSENAMMKEVSKYMNSAHLIPLTDEKVAQINSLFGFDIITRKGEICNIPQTYFNMAELREIQDVLAEMIDSPEDLKNLSANQLEVLNMVVDDKPIEILEDEIYQSEMEETASTEDEYEMIL